MLNAGFDLKILIVPTDQKSKIAAKSTASVFSTESAYLGDVPAQTQASQAGSVEKTEAVDLAKKIFHRLILSIEHSGKSPWL